MAKKVLSKNFSELNKGMKTARIDIHAGDGNMTIDRLAGDESVLACGTLQYIEDQSQPTSSLVSNNGQGILTLKSGGGKQRWFHLPWSACNGATEWHIHLNPMVTADITAHSDGGNLSLDLAGMAITGVSADTGGGNVNMVLPGEVTNLSVVAKTGAGDIVVTIPSGVAARIHAKTGLGKAIIDPQYTQTGKDSYQSPDFNSADKKVEITAQSGAGNVVVNHR